MMTPAVGDRSSGRTARKELQSLGGIRPRDASLIREPIAESWRRSQEFGVDPSQIEPREAAAELSDGAVLQCVDKVLSRAAERLANEAVTILFATPDGSVVRRYSGDRDLTRLLDSVHLAPGSGYDEASVGTNGIGTAAQTRLPTLVHGREHYNEQLSVFTCAGQPVFHPITGSIVGVVDFTCYADYGTALLLSFTSTLAAQIEHALLELIEADEAQLLREYLGACRHTSGPVFAQGREVVMMNRHAQQMLTPEDRASLLIHSADFVGMSIQETMVADLPSGLSALLSYKPSSLDGRVVGGIVRVRLDSAQSSPSALTSSRVRTQPLTGLVGSSPEWMRASELVLGHAKRGTSLIVSGEDFIGKAALVRAAHYTATPTQRLAVVDCRNVEDIDVFLDELEHEFEGHGTLLLREIERLPKDAISAVSELLVEHRSTPPDVGPRWIVTTRVMGIDDSAIESALLPNFDVTVTVPPLRHRPDDIAKLAVHLLTRFDREGRVRFDDAALRHLSRLPWEGNLAQLGEVVRECVQTKRTGTIGIEDLPAQCDSTVRRTLTPMEAIQRDAIVDALRIHGGHKPSAAEHVGISRATIYRKIREFGIEVRKLKPKSAK